MYHSFLPMRGKVRSRVGAAYEHVLVEAQFSIFDALTVAEELSIYSHMIC